MNIKSLLLILIMSLSIFVFSGCRKNAEINDPDTPNTKGKIQLAEKTKIIETSLGLSAVAVDSTKLTFRFNSNSNSNGPSIQVGDILIGKSGRGYIRKVESVTTTGNTVTVGTSNASLDQAYSSLSIDTSLTFSPDVQNLEAINYNTTIDGKNGKLNYSVNSDKPRMRINKQSGEATILFTNLSYKIETKEKNASFEVSADTVSYTFTCGVDRFNINIGWIDFFNYGLTNFSLIYKINQNIAFNGVKMILNGNISKQFPDEDHENLLKTDLYLGTIPIGFVWLDWYFNIAAGIEGEFAMSAETDLNNRFSASSSLRVGAEYSGGNWHGVWDPSSSVSSKMDMTVIPNISGTARLFLKPKIKAKLCSVAGPDVSVRGYSYGRISYPPLKLAYGMGLDGKVGYIVEVFGWRVSGYDWDLPQNEWEFGQRTW